VSAGAVSVANPSVIVAWSIRRRRRPRGADRQLIAAAPRMFKALKKAIKDYGKPGGPWNVPNEPGTWIALAHAAIQAAEGK